MQRDGRLGPKFWLRYLRAVLRHYEEGFWLVVLVILNSIPGLKQFAKFLGIVGFAERRAASVAMCGHYRAHDVALSLLRMVSNNIGQVATLYAQQVPPSPPRLSLPACIIAASTVISKISAAKYVGGYAAHHLRRLFHSRAPLYYCYHFSRGTVFQSRADPTSFPKARLLCGCHRCPFAGPARRERYPRYTTSAASNNGTFCVDHSFADGIERLMINAACHNRVV
eukprot:scaffold142472_cov35-Tisochrysis_lutea.AAC.3